MFLASSAQYLTEGEFGICAIYISLHTLYIQNPGYGLRLPSFSIQFCLNPTFPSLSDSDHDVAPIRTYTLHMYLALL